MILENIRKLVITSNDEYVITCADDKTIKVWDMEERKLVHTFEEAHSGGIWALAVTSDNRSIISGSADKHIKIWELGPYAIPHDDLPDLSHNKVK